MNQMPNYSKYTLEELLDVYRHINKKQFPDRVKIVIEEIEKRRTEEALKKPSSDSGSLPNTEVGKKKAPRELKARKKFQVLIIVGFVLLFGVLIIDQFQKGKVTVLGQHFFKLGNKTILLNPPEGMLYVSDEKKINAYLPNLSKNLAFIIVGDSSNNNFPLIFADFLQMGDYDSTDKLLDFLEQDSSLVLIHKKITPEELELKYRTNDGSNFLLARYYECYPYYLRVRSVWSVGTKNTDKVFQAFNSIEVKK